MITFGTLKFMNTRNRDTWFLMAFVTCWTMSCDKFFAAGGPFLSAFLLSWFLSNKIVHLAAFLIAGHTGGEMTGLPSSTLLLIVHCWQELTDPFHLCISDVSCKFKQLLVSTISHKFLEGVVSVSWLCVIWFTGNWGGRKSHWCYLQALVEIISEGNLLICGH